MRNWNRRAVRVEPTRELLAACFRDLQESDAGQVRTHPGR